MKKALLLVVVLAFIMSFLTGCWWETESDKVSYNLSKEADNFNVIR
jgi:hypothetical protein